ncbi:L-ascorbate peroxidase 1, cytosolic [Acorus calamus]|uniref:L-ascorbate peroxidase 1, cytosolic n=1 Tax=Acorus calamus TaxID=4465 RepID=A0AAV9F3K2_ACOCL|nr:L-ascorbate peroxidase 1, cytosolic [Acorus calamus]
MDEDAFFADYVEAHMKLSELGSRLELGTQGFSNIKKPQTHDFLCHYDPNCTSINDLFSPMPSVVITIPPGHHHQHQRA